MRDMAATSPTITKRDYINSKLVNLVKLCNDNAEVKAIVTASGLVLPTLPLNDDDYVAFVRGVTTILVPQQRSLAHKLSVLDTSYISEQVALGDLFELPGLAYAALPENLKCVYTRTIVSKELACKLLSYACCFVDVLLNE